MPAAEDRQARALEGILGQLVMLNGQLKRMYVPKEQVESSDADTFAAMPPLKKSDTQAALRDVMMPCVSLTKSKLQDSFLFTDETTKVDFEGVLYYPEVEPCKVTGEMFIRRD